MSAHIRYGIIGCGSMGREHIENIQALPRSEGGASVTALADPHGPSRDASAVQIVTADLGPVAD